MLRVSLLFLLATLVYRVAASMPREDARVPAPPANGLFRGDVRPNADDAPFTLSDASLRTSQGYIIKLRRFGRADDLDAYIRAFNRQAGLPEAPPTLAPYEPARHDGPHDDHPNCVRRAYDAAVYHGVSARVTHECMQRMRVRFAADIEYVERDARVYAAAVQRPVPSWGLQRISSARRLDNAAAVPTGYAYPDTAGAGTHVYVLDTGIQADHREFQRATDGGSRAHAAVTFVDGEDNVDLHGHGTHVAGVVAGTQYGVAKLADVYGVKVLGRNGDGAMSNVVAGLQFVASRVTRGRTVVNLSLAGPISRALNDAVAATIRAGAVVVVAAGNADQDACTTSPASAPGVISVGASDVNDARATFSNWGRCVHLFAPGVDIRSAWASRASRTSSAVMSGTSQAAPHVAGIAAFYMSTFTYADPGDVVVDVVQGALGGVLNAATLRGSPNALAYNNPPWWSAEAAPSTSA